MAILSLAQAKARIGIAESDASRDTQITALVAGIEECVQREACCYVEAEATEVYDGTGATQLVLRREPVRIGISDAPFSIRFATDAKRRFADADDVDDETYYVDEEAAIVHYSAGFPTLPASVRITYTAGVPEESYPEDLKLVIAELLSLSANRIGSAGLSSESFSAYSYVLQNFGDLESQLSAASRMTLDSYRARANVWVR
jgi:hypothetical protein